MAAFRALTIRPTSVDETPAPAGSTEGHLSTTTQPALETQRTLDASHDGESRFRTLAESVPVVVWMTDENNSATYISRYWREYTGRDPQQDLGYKWIEAVHPEDRDRV